MSAAMRWKALRTPMPQQLRLSDLLTHLPVAVLKASFTGAAKPTPKRGRA